MNCCSRLTSLHLRLRVLLLAHDHMIQDVDHAQVFRFECIGLLHFQSVVRPMLLDAILHTSQGPRDKMTSGVLGGLKNLRDLL